MGTGTSVDLAPPLSGWAPGTYTVRLKATDPAGATNTEDTSFRVRVDCRRRVCSNGNPAAPGVVHPVSLSKSVSLRVNKPDPVLGQLRAHLHRPPRARPPRCRPRRSRVTPAPRSR